VAYVIIENGFTREEKLTSGQQWTFTLGLALSTAVDLLITGSLLSVLQVSKKKSFTLDGVIDSLILYTIENAAMTTYAHVLPSANISS
jgi:hypothetical protein